MVSSRSHSAISANSFPILFCIPAAKGGRLKDAMLYAIPYPWIPPNPSDAEPSLLRLTHCCLERCNLDTGKLIETFRLGMGASFKYLSWNEPCHSILIKSKKFLHKNRFNEQFTTIDFLLFDVAPLTATVAVTFNSELFRRKVDPLIREFDVNIDNYLLIITVNKMVHLYSFKALLERNRPDPKLPPYDQLDGYSNNVDIKELPPRLLSVKSKQPENMTFGGFPLHVLYMTEDGSMRLQRVGDEEVVHVFRPQDVSIDQEAVVFANNFDDLIYWRGSNFFRICAVEESRVRQIFEFNCLRPASTSEQITFSRFGRPLRRRRSSDADASLSPTVLYLAYDDDLDLLVLLVAVPRPGAESFLYAEFRESCTGEPFRSTPLLEVTESEEDQEWTLQADLTYLVLTSQRLPSDYCCRVFELLER